MKKSFLIHLDSLEILDELTDEQVGKLFRAFRVYHLGIEPELDQILRIAFKPFQLQFDRDGKKYKETAERNALNGSLGGRPKKATQTDKKPKNPVGYSGLSQNPKKADNDSDSDSDNNNDNDSVSVKDNDLLNISDLSRFESKYDKQMLADFQAYWTETNSKGKMRYEAEKFFDISRRLATWARNQNSFSKNKKNEQTVDVSGARSHRMHESFNFTP